MRVTKLIGLDFSLVFSYYFPVRFKFCPHLPVVFYPDDRRHIFHIKAEENCSQYHCTVCVDRAA